MRKEISLFVVMLLAVMLPLTACAYDFSAISPSGQRLYYNYVNGHAEVVCPFDGVSSGNYISGDLIIPDSVNYNGTFIEVTAFATIYSSLYDRYYGTFTNCSGLTSITIPSSIVSIGEYSFNGCSGLTEISIPGNVNFIGEYAFYGCSGITTITIPSGVTSIEAGTFAGCTGLTSIILPSNITAIGDRAFIGCTGLSSITIPSGITAIGDYVFAGCTSLTSIEIPSGVTNIGEFAFYQCNGLSSITIPDSVTNIGRYAFDGCVNLSSITIPDGVITIGSEAFYGIGHIEYHGTATGGPWGAISMNGYIVGDFVFEDSTMTTLSRYLGNNVSVSIPESVTTIGYAAFSGCSSLTAVNFHSGITTIGIDAFANCNNLISVTLPNSITYIGYTAFYGCSNLISVVLPDSLLSIEDGTFADCSSLTSINIPDNDTLIGSEAFYNCSSLADVTFGQGLIYIADWAFKNCAITSVTIPSNVIGIGYEAFWGCYNLDTVHLYSNQPPELGSDAFGFNASNRVFIIHGCGYNNYRYSSAGGWYNYQYYLREAVIDLQITVNTNDPATGFVTIWEEYGHAVRCDSTAVYFATPAMGYHFDHWSNGRTANPDTVKLSGDSVVTAFFAPDIYTIVLQSSDSNMGTVNSGGEYYYQDTITIIATPVEHNHFLYWSDGSRDNPRQYVVQGDVTLTAYFAIDTHVVTLVPNDNMRGTVTGSDEYTYGQACIAQAYAYNGYVFTGWSDGTTSNPYAFPVLGDVELTAFFEPLQELEDVIDDYGIIYVVDRHIKVERANGNTVTLYDINGRVLATKQDYDMPLKFDVPATGMYMIKVGSASARRVVVIR